MWYPPQDLPHFINMFSPKLPANIQFTSGTTGNPKAAALSHFNMINNAQSVIDISNKTFYEDPTQDHSLPMPLCEHTVWNCLVPLYHVFGFVGVSVLSTMIKCEMGKENPIIGHHRKSILGFPHPGFNSDAALNAIEARGATVMSGTPTMLIDILNNEDFDTYDTSTMRYVSGGGAPVTQSLINETTAKMGARVRLSMVNST